MNVKNISILVLLVIFTTLVVVKIIVLNYTPSTILPETGYRVLLEMEADGHGSEINIRAMLPPNIQHQDIFDEQITSGDFNYGQINAGLNRIGRWYNSSISNHQKITYTFDVISKQVNFILPEKMHIPVSVSPGLQRYLEETELVQTGHNDIIQQLSTLGIDRNSDMIEAITAIYNYISNDIATTGFSGKTDAITTLRLQEASCNGKSRLFVAMLRTLGIPSRLVGGIILKQGTKTVTHQWLEVLVGDQWVAMDPTNKHFAVTPKYYLIAYYGDEPFFKRTSNVNFKYIFNIERKNFTRSADIEGLAAHPLNIMNAWSLFNKAGLSMSLLRVILLIPLGAIVTIIFRNVIGIQTFGTFLPALIASSFRQTNLFWGVIAFSSIIVVGSLLRWVIDKLKITHTPKLTILLVFVVLAILVISATGVLIDNMYLAKATLFPLALMAITIERFALITQESGSKEAFKIYTNTIITVIFCYIVINSEVLQTFVMAFPETMLLVIAAGLYFGNWVGIRVTELTRFRKLIFNVEKTA